jgi:hypothetical protein
MKILVPIDHDRYIRVYDTTVRTPTTTNTFIL